MLVVNFDPFPTLITERLMLRQILTADAPAIFALRCNKEAMQFIDRPMAVSIDDALQYIHKLTASLTTNEGISWGICLKEDAALIGTIGFWRIDKANYRAEIGYMLHPSQHKKGYMQEAISATLEYGFTTMRLHSVEANINPANEASKKILEKNNFLQKAFFRQNYYYNGQFLDSSIYSLLNPLN